MVGDATTLEVDSVIPVLDLKREIVAALRTELRVQLKDAKSRADDAREAATHEENKPENDKDMRSTEAAYIARGQAERVALLDRGIAKLTAMELVAFNDTDGVAISALVTLAHGEHGEIETTYFMVTDGGGMNVNVQNTTISSLATTSPLGRALLGLGQGDEVTAGPRRTKYEIVKVR